MSALRSLGRRIRLAVIGGGGGALIGPVHRVAARFDNSFVIVAGVLSSDPKKAIREAARLRIPRGYGAIGELIEGEHGREDAVEAVSISTPNDSHHALAKAALEAGLHVICDKPVTNTLEEAKDLARLAEEHQRIFCLTHNYSGYPMVRQARSMVKQGRLGVVRLVHVVYAQGTLGRRVEDGEIPARLRWRLDPERGGNSHVLGDIGTHAHQLATYISGLDVEQVFAEVGAVVPGRKVDDTASVLMRFSGGGQGVLWVTKAASGAENALTIELYGEDGGLAWEQVRPNSLRFMKQGQPAQILTRGQAGNVVEAQRITRVPPGLGEGFHAAFANIYNDFAEAVAAQLLGIKPDPPSMDFPKADDGVAGMAFVEAALKSSSQSRWVALNS